ncbi:MAG: IPTL-CTERM sorting domain-containing protein [Comamonadaceae bacterium]|nr:IPTL-CTERM sorting domain-containing protein [Comamonadaceae bacterium]
MPLCPQPAPQVHASCVTFTYSSVSPLLIYTSPIKRNRGIVLGVCLSAAMLMAGSAFAAVAPSLATADAFAVLGASTVTNTGPTFVTGNLGVYPGSAVTGFPPGVLNGTWHTNNAVANQAHSDAVTAYTQLAGQSIDFNRTGVDLAGLTLLPGVHGFDSGAALTGTLTLDGVDDPAAVFVIRVAEALTVGTGSNVELVRGAQSCNVFWQIGSSATLLSNAALVGTVVANDSITLVTGASIAGRALALNAAVTLDSNTVLRSACNPLPSTPVLSQSYSPSTIVPGGQTVLTLTLANPGDTDSALTQPLVVTLPTGVTVAGTPDVTTTCIGSAVPLAVAGGNSVTLPAGRSIPAGGSCTVSVRITAPSQGSFTLILVPGLLVTDGGSSLGDTGVTLNVVSTPALASIPTLSEWGLLMLSLLVAGGVWLRLFRQSATA